MTIKTRIRDWPLTRLGDHCKKPQYGYTASAIWDRTSGFRILRITDLTDLGVDWSTVPFCQISSTTAQTYLLRPDDLVVARIGATTGKAFRIEECPAAVFASYLIRIRTRNDLDPKYLAFYFQSESYWRQINQKKGARL